MRSKVCWKIVPAVLGSVLCHAAPSFASDATSSPGERVVAIATVVAAAMLALGFVLYFEVASLRPLVLRTGIEARAREEREENARQEVAKASVDLCAALMDLREQLRLARSAVVPEPAVERASDRPRDTLMMATPPIVTTPPPGENAARIEVGDDDPIRVQSREAIEQAMAGEPLSPLRGER